MIKDKTSKAPILEAEPPAVPESPPENPPEAVDVNPFVEMYRAVRRAILTVRENPDDATSPPLFRTVALDNGQFARILRSGNEEYEVAFPAVFIHFVNVRYLVQQQRIGEGRATMRVRFILNTLNNSDVERECDPFIVFQRLNIAIQDAKDREPALSERCNLTYFDMPETTNMLQAYWIDYEVWFREASAWKYRDWVKRYLVMPPFTQHGDAPQHDTEGHGTHTAPAYGEVSGYAGIAGDDEPEKEKETEKEEEEEGE